MGWAGVDNLDLIFEVSLMEIEALVSATAWYVLFGFQELMAYSLLSILKDL